MVFEVSASKTAAYLMTASLTFRRPPANNKEQRIPRRRSRQTGFGERSRENKGPAGGGVTGRGRRERRDRGGNDKGENDESGTTARWHEGCSEKRRETAKRDTKRQTPQGGRRLAHHTPLLKIPVWWRRAVLPSLPWVVCFLSFFLYGMEGEPHRTYRT